MSSNVQFGTTIASGDVEAANPGWRAGVVPLVAGLRPASVARLGFNISPKDIDIARRTADWSLQGFDTPALPRRVDWRDHDHAHWLSPVRDQGELPLAVAFAVTAVLEARARIQKGDPKLDLMLSPAHLFFCGGGSTEAGWSFDAALKFCRDRGGVALEADFPYRGTAELCRDAAGAVGIDTWATRSTPEARRLAIARNGPVAAGMRVYEDFARYQGGVYRHATGEFCGIHAVAVVGYDDELQAWIVRNSWGDRWGDGGYAYVAYDRDGLSDEFVFFDPCLRTRAVA
jgi:C1A family cysteine protease